MAKFAISAMMFNHVVSAMDAIWSTQNKNRPKKSKELKTDVGLLSVSYTHLRAHEK